MFTSAHGNNNYRIDKLKATLDELNGNTHYYSDELLCHHIVAL